MATFISKIKKFKFILSSYKVLHPKFLQIEVTNHCNLKCRTCSRDEFLSKYGSMSFNDFEVILERFNLSKIKRIHFGGYGEPLLNKQLVEMILQIPSYIFTKINTNLSIRNNDLIISLVKSGIGRISVSLDGFDKNTYENVRTGGSWETVIKI